MSLNEELRENADAVRKITGKTGLLSLSEMAESLNNLQRIKIMMDGDSSNVDFNTINDLSFRYITTPNGVNNDSVPIKGAWWYLLTLTNNPMNAIQIAIPDKATSIYLRCKIAGNWNGWYDLGGGSKYFPKIFKQFKTLLSLTICKGGVTLVA